ncbi:MAG: hypothetical protein ABIP54_04570 [Candidatus Andersenbacteria bacterium]
MKKHVLTAVVTACIVSAFWGAILTIVNQQDQRRSKVESPPVIVVAGGSRWDAIATVESVGYETQLIRFVPTNTKYVRVWCPGDEQLGLLFEVPSGIVVRLASENRALFFSKPDSDKVIMLAKMGSPERRIAYDWRIKAIGDEDKFSGPLNAQLGDDNVTVRQRIEAALKTL